MALLKDISGATFGKLTALKSVGKTKAGNAVWLCLCECGNTIEVAQGNLGKHVQSCGCLRQWRNIYTDCGSFFQLEMAKSDKRFLCIFDADDVDKILEYKWMPHYNVHTKTYYAHASTHFGGKKATAAMQRIVLNLDFGDPRIADHINHNTLDNRKMNLRITDKCGNGRNQRRRSDNTSGYKGVSFDITKNKWIATVAIWNGGRQKYLYKKGFDSEEDAAKAYNDAALKHFGEFAYLNEIEY